MSDTQCAQQGQLFVVAHDLKPPATTGRGRLVFAPATHNNGGADLGEALCTVPSGDCWWVAVHRDRHSGIYFDSARGDEELWTAGGLWHGLQCGWRAALRDVHPQLFIDEEPAEAAP